MIRSAFLFFLAIGAAACEPRPSPELLPFDHPADPYAEGGKPLRVPDALRPELKTVAPNIEPADKAPAASPPSDMKKEPSGEHHH